MTLIWDQFLIEKQGSWNSLLWYWTRLLTSPTTDSLLHVMTCVLLYRYTFRRKPSPREWTCWIYVVHRALSVVPTLSMCSARIAIHPTTASGVPPANRPPSGEIHSTCIRVEVMNRHSLTSSLTGTLHQLLALSGLLLKVRYTRSFL